MNAVALGVLIVFSCFLFFFISFYHSLIIARNECSRKWSRVEPELMRRYEIAAYLADAIKTAMPEQEELFQRVLAARNQARENYASLHSRAKDENTMIYELRKLFETAEQCPGLLASHQFQRLQEELIKTEFHIQQYRAEYNNKVFDYNDLVDSPPTRRVALLFHFNKKEPFDVEINTIRVKHREEKIIAEEIE